MTQSSRINEIPLDIWLETMPSLLTINDRIATWKTLRNLYPEKFQETNAWKEENILKPIEENLQNFISTSLVTNKFESIVKIENDKDGI